MAAQKKYPDELRERAVKMLFEVRDERVRGTGSWPGGGATLTRVHLSSYPHESGTPQSAELRSAAILDRELDTRPRVRSVSYFPDFMSARAVTYGCVLHRNRLYRLQ